MELVAPFTNIFNTGSILSAELLENTAFPLAAEHDIDDLVFEIGLWLSGLESFLHTHEQSFEHKNRVNEVTRDWTKEFRLTYSALIICSKLNFRLKKTFAEPRVSSGTLLSIDVEDSDDLSFVLRDAITINDGMIRAEPLKFEEWKVWNNLLAEKLRSSVVVRNFIDQADRSAEDYLPTSLRTILQSKKIPFADHADLNLILPRFAKILKSLSIVGRMLRNDEPLKPTLLIFSKVYEQTQELISYINNRLARFPDEEAELFNSLDAASYTASLELKKVYNQELTGLVGIRPAPSIYARIETAYALLSDSFQQILAGFARLIEPAVSVSDLFPNFRIKLEQSLNLRKQLWRVLQAVQAAEQNPEKKPLDDLKKELSGFLSETIGYLFFKDKETLERFGEEIFATTDKKDLVPILHRFGTYLETLSGQVNMRNVLANHPFEPNN
ncbi:MAG: hypothetical protein H7070_01765 [Saprospiraceae bacterium]|nr:hypothetical protein [Pyrinomonadaceae bacterium]